MLRYLLVCLLMGGVGMVTSIADFYTGFSYNIYNIGFSHIKRRAWQNAPLCAIMGQIRKRSSCEARRGVNAAYPQIAHELLLYCE